LIIPPGRLCAVAESPTRAGLPPAMARQTGDSAAGWPTRLRSFASPSGKPTLCTYRMMPSLSTR
jgi:hypothetical protein